MVCTIDLAASFAAMVGVKLPEDGCLDSFDVMAALLGKSGAKGREHLVQQDNGRGGNYGFRVGDWKLQRRDSKKKRNAKLRLQTQAAPRITLFNLADDLREKKNLAEQDPERAERMQARLQSIIDAGRSRPKE